MNATNPTLAAFRAAGAFNGLSPLDESVAAHREAQRDLDEARREVPARMHAEIMELQAALSASRDALARALDEIDALREALVGQREGVTA